MTTYDCLSSTGDIPRIAALAQCVSKPQTDCKAVQLKTGLFWRENRVRMANFQTASLEAINTFKLERLKRLVDFAYANVPFYRQLYSAAGYQPGGISSFEDFSSLPMVTKRQLRDAEISERVSAPEKLDTTPSTRTSGSSGSPFISYHDESDVIRDYCEVLRFYNSCLKRPLAEDDWIYMIHNAGLWMSSFDGKYRTFQLPDLLPDTPLATHLDYLQPRILSTLPSYLPLIKKMGVPLTEFGVEAIITNSECSTRKERQAYAQALGVPVFDEYSSEELGLIATQCSEGEYHTVEDGVHVEILDKDASGLGTVVCTDLNNWFMPLIRFDHGDLARDIPQGQACQCGRAGMRLSEVNGRRDDAFLTRDKRIVPSASILAAVDDILVEHDLGLNEFRVIQSSATNITLQTIYNGPTYAEVPTLLNNFKLRLTALFGYPISLLHQEVDALPQADSYKRKCLIRTWE